MSHRRRHRNTHRPRARASFEVRRHLPPLGTALRESLRDGYDRRSLWQDLVAGISVGIIAVPLSLALAIATGVPPEHGLYTAIVAGALIALAGGSRYSVSGPTAAFIVILLPITAQHGVGGLLLATFMAGVLMVAMGWGRMGQLIRYIPYEVTTGFTAGIALVIASLQFKDLLGLDLASQPAGFIERFVAVIGSAPSFVPGEVILGLATLTVLLLWPRLRLPVPSYLIAALFAGGLAWLLGAFWPEQAVTTIADRFSHVRDGVTVPGIPAALPAFHWPWALPGVDGAPLMLSWSLLADLAGPAFAIAMLGAIESLLCGVVADGMTGQRHDPDAELVAQGLGNIVTPLFGGIPATGALARTAANVRAGARSPLAAIFHALFVLLTLLTLAPVLSWLPMAGLAAILLIVAWNMSETHRFLRVIRVAPRGDVMLMLSCFTLTVLVDMVVAITVGVVLGSLMFMHRMAKVSTVHQLETGAPGAPSELPPDVRYYAIAGPLFFGAAERAVRALQHHGTPVRAVLLDLSAVPTIDASGLVALEDVIESFNREGIFVALCGAQRTVLRVLRESGDFKRAGHHWSYRSVDSALAALRRHAPESTSRDEGA